MHEFLVLSYRMQGFGFVTFANSSDAERARERINGNKTKNTFFNQFKKEKRKKNETNQQFE